MHILIFTIICFCISWLCQNNSFKLKNKELNNDILNLYNDIKTNLSLLSLIIGIDYNIKISINNKNKSSIVLNIFNTYDFSKIGRQISLIDTNNWKIRCPVIKTINSTIYEENYFIFDNLNYSHSTSIILLKGFPFLNIFSNGFEKGKKFGKNFKG